MTDRTTYQRPGENETGSDAQLTREQKRTIDRMMFVHLTVAAAEDERTQDVALPADAPG